jgi:hypothetical protein
MFAIVGSRFGACQPEVSVTEIGDGRCRQYFRRREREVKEMTMIRIPRGLSRRSAMIVGILLVLAGGAGWGQPLEALSDQYPSAELSPDDVVRIQMEAFRNNDSEDTGIAIAFRFASPQNKEQTGPLSRFRMMMRSPLYQPMLNAETVEYGRATVQERIARVEVTTVAPDGERTSYAFYLMQQRGGEFEDAWMTEAVEVLSDGGVDPGGSV